MDDLKVSVGLYRHFKGSYFYVTNVARSCTSTEDVDYLVNYFDVCHPEVGMFSRKLEDFTSLFDQREDGEIVYIKCREDNVTGQFHRFERVKDLNFQLGSVSTEQLIDELRTRTDSPIHELDIEGMRSDIYAVDYVVGRKYPPMENTPAGVDTCNSFFNEEDAKDYFSHQVAKSRMSVFKRVFIEIK